MALRASLPLSTSDCLGTAAALLCAVHCMAAPVILSAAPLLGSFWTAPWMHWAFASISLPAAFLLIRKGARAHRRAWVLGLAVAGIGLLLVGLSAPGADWSAALGLQVPAPQWLAALADTDPASVSGCADACCASVHTQAEASVLTLPFASWITVLGGCSLIIAHLANLWLSGCARCAPRL